MHVPVTPLNHSIILVIPDWTSGHHYFITTCKSPLPHTVPSDALSLCPNQAKLCKVCCHSSPPGGLGPSSVLLALRGPSLRVKIVVLVSVRMFSLEGRLWELLQSLLGY